jgi:hypothetical protein
MNDWLYACVAAERAFATIRGVNFEKKRSKRVATWMILALFLFIVGTSVHEPIHRRLLDDVEEGRRWCIIQYSTERAQLFATKGLSNILWLLDKNIAFVRIFGTN